MNVGIENTLILSLFKDMLYFFKQHLRCYEQKILAKLKKKSADYSLAAARVIVGRVILKGLSLIRIMSNFDFLDPGQ